MNKYSVRVCYDTFPDSRIEVTSIKKAMNVVNKHKKHYCLISKPYYPSRKYKLIHNKYTKPYTVVVQRYGMFDWCPTFEDLDEAKSFRNLFDGNGSKATIWCSVKEFIPE